MRRSENELGARHADKFATYSLLIVHPRTPTNVPRPIEQFSRERPDNNKHLSNQPSSDLPPIEELRGFEGRNSI